MRDHELLAESLALLAESIEITPAEGATLLAAFETNAIATGCKFGVKNTAWH
jgi:hypothetical protein